MNTGTCSWGGASGAWFTSGRASFLSHGTAPNPPTSGKPVIACRRASSPGSLTRTRGPAEPTISAPEPWSVLERSSSFASSASRIHPKDQSRPAEAARPASVSIAAVDPSQSRSLPSRWTPASTSPSICCLGISPWKEENEKPVGGDGREPRTFRPTTDDASEDRGADSTGGSLRTPRLSAEMRAMAASVIIDSRAVPARLFSWPGRTAEKES